MYIKFTSILIHLLVIHMESTRKLVVKPEEFYHVMKFTAVSEDGKKEEQLIWILNVKLDATKSLPMNGFIHQISLSVYKIDPLAYHLVDGYFEGENLNVVDVLPYIDTDNFVQHSEDFYKTLYPSTKSASHIMKPDRVEPILYKEIFSNSKIEIDIYLKSLEYRGNKMLILDTGSKKSLWGAPIPLSFSTNDVMNSGKKELHFTNMQVSIPNSKAKTFKTLNDISIIKTMGEHPLESLCNAIRTKHEGNGWKQIGRFFSKPFIGNADKIAKESILLTSRIWERNKEMFKLTRNKKPIKVDKPLNEELKEEEECITILDYLNEEDGHLQVEIEGSGKTELNVIKYDSKIKSTSFPYASIIPESSYEDIDEKVDQETLLFRVKNQYYKLIVDIQEKKLFNKIDDEIEGKNAEEEKEQLEQLQNEKQDEEQQVILEQIQNEEQQKQLEQIQNEENLEQIQDEEQQEQLHDKEKQHDEEKREQIQNEEHLEKIQDEEQQKQLHDKEQQEQIQNEEYLEQIQNEEKQHDDGGQEKLERIQNEEKQEQLHDDGGQEKLERIQNEEYLEQIQNEEYLEQIQNEEHLEKIKDKKQQEQLHDKEKQEQIQNEEHLEKIQDKEKQEQIQNEEYLEQIQNEEKQHDDGGQEKLERIQNEEKQEQLHDDGGQEKLERIQNEEKQEQLHDDGGHTNEQQEHHHLQQEKHKQDDDGEYSDELDDKHDSKQDYEQNDKQYDEQVGEDGHDDGGQDDKKVGADDEHAGNKVLIQQNSQENPEQKNDDKKNKDEGQKGNQEKSDTLENKHKNEQQEKKLEESENKDTPDKINNKNLSNKNKNKKVIIVGVIFVAAVVILGVCLGLAYLKLRSVSDNEQYKS